jgi:O-succinylbenzoic acid--CoA ligase
VAGFSLLARSIVFGNPISILPKFDESEVLAAVKNGATHVSLVPTTLFRINPANFESILLGGAAAPPNLPANVTTTYGMTETFGGISYNGSPLDGVEVRVVDGQFEVRTPSMFRAYRGSDTRQAKEGWYQTGDNGIFTDNVLQVFGRSDDMIITGGENVWPSEVEKAAATFPGVERVAVVGVDDAQWGQRVVAFIVSSLENGPSLQDIRDHVKQQLTPFCAPSDIQLLSEFPTTSLGKVDFQALKKLI